ncbi:MAG: hypothetical protein ACRC9X_03850 [Bacteroidales bacterium]
MTNKEIIPLNYELRIDEVMSKSWKIFISQFIHKRYIVNKEAPFQHHFAQIIKSVGDLYSITEKDLFKVDLETKIEGIKKDNKSKYFDLSCLFYDKIKCGIELKFKLKRQGAQDEGRIDSYFDIECLERAVLDLKVFDIGKFYMITDDTAYINESIKGKSGTIFCLHNGYETIPNKTLNCPNNKRRKDIIVELKQKYKFNWEKVDEWYFLEITIRKE